jgi:preprotein translocase subunit SecD
MAAGPPPRRGLIVSFVLVVVIAFGSLLATLAAGWSPRLGLDLAGGLAVIYKPAHAVTTSELNETVTIITNRVDSLGVSGAEVNLQGTNIVVTIPGITDARQVLAAVGQTAQLYFRPVLCQSFPIDAKLKPVAPLPACNPSTLMTAQALGVTVDSLGNIHTNNIPPDTTFNSILSTPPSVDAVTPNAQVLLPILGVKDQRYVLGPAELNGTIVSSAVAQQNSTGQWVVNYTLTPSGSPRWDAMAQRYFHAMIALELDGVVQSAPIILPDAKTFTSFQGQGEISGSFTEASAKNLALAMNYGALPVRLVPLTTETISPTLGHNSLVAGLGAGIVGLLLVLLYTIVYYRSLGIVIVLGLAVTAALLWAIICAMGHTSFAPSFDLAGVTGLIVSIGITVDSYIVYFERLKDEARAGRTVRTSVDRGFKSAWRTVLAADTVSLLAAILLYLIAVGSVRGFAFFLGLSTLLDIIITWYFTRPVVMLLGRRESAASGSMLSVAAGIGATAAAHD